MQDYGDVHVKGSALKTSVAFISAKFGESGWKKVLSSLPDKDREILSKRVLVSSWYPFSSYLSLLTTADKMFGKGDFALCADMGRYSAESDLGSVYMVFNKEANPHFIISRAAAIWKTYYDSGRMEIAEKGDKSVTLRILGFSSPARQHCLRVQGWMEMALRLSGGRNVRVFESKCRCAGGDCCEYKCGWD